MSDRIYIKPVEVVSWVREIERIQSITDDEAREDAFLEMLYHSGNEPEQVMTGSEAFWGVNAYNQIEKSFEAEMRRKTNIFLESLPQRNVPDEAPLPIGRRFPLIEEEIGGWLLTPADILQLIELGRAIDFYCQAEVTRFANLTFKQRLFSLSSTREQREWNFRQLWSYVARWTKILQTARKNDTGLLVWML